MSVGIVCSLSDIKISYPISFARNPFVLLQSRVHNQRGKKYIVNTHNDALCQICVETHALEMPHNIILAIVYLEMVVKQSTCISK